MFGDQIRDAAHITTTDTHSVSPSLVCGTVVLNSERIDDTGTSGLETLQTRGVVHIDVFAFFCVVWT